MYVERVAIFSDGVKYNVEGQDWVERFILLGCNHAKSILQSTDAAVTDITSSHIIEHM